ncbi:MAG: hypothetical protein ACYS7Y_16470 [Planctomycetota bacterium]|jgi:hypothetical protein
MIGHRILMGLWCGFLASIGYQLVKRFLKPQGIVLPERPEDLMITDLKKAKDNAYKRVLSQSLIDDDDDDFEDTPVETPSAQMRRARSETEKKIFVPPRSEDLFKPPKI